MVLYLAVPGEVEQINTPSPQSTRLVILSPLPGQAVQGKVAINGSTAVDGFQSYELAFAYSQDPTDTWFLIQEGDSPINEGQIAQWDTSTITDGDYSLRLTVTLVDGRQLTTVVSGVRVRNYTPIETDTPAPTSTLAPGAISTPNITPSLTATPLPATPTPLPTNPASLSMNQVISSWGKGALISLGVLVFLWVYQGIRHLMRK
jgi:hypothetical protein